MQLIGRKQVFSYGLLLLINSICGLANDNTDLCSGTEQRISSKINRIKSCLLTLKQVPNDIRCTNFEDLPLGTYVKCAQDDIMKRRLESLVAAVEANRLGTLLLLGAQISVMFPHVILDCKSRDTKQIHEILFLAEDVCEKDTMAASLPIWPSFSLDTSAEGSTVCVFLAF